jgi:hypothetical protein
MEIDDGYLEWALIYRKLVGGYKDIENNFYSNDLLNNDLYSKF